MATSLDAGISWEGTDLSSGRFYGTDFIDSTETITLLDDGTRSNISTFDTNVASVSMHSSYTYAPGWQHVYDTGSSTSVSECNNLSGTWVDHGYDNNFNNQLDTNEITETIMYCSGNALEDSITTLTVNDGGYDYSAGTLSATGGSGSGFSGTYSISSAIASISVNSGGTGYAVGDTLSFLCPGSGCTEGTNASASNFDPNANTTVAFGGALDNSFATLRSHMLLFSFAMSLGVRQVARMTKEAAKLQSMERAFGGLSGGASNAAIAVDKLKEATNGTLSEFDLFQQANNAMILGVTKNSDEMAQMFDMAQRLGNALGKDTKLSVESLITGIGRQSRLMLDNIGIIVKSEQAYEAYAAELGTTADNLTKSEKRQAFMNAALEAGQNALLSMPNEILNADQKFQALSASLDNASKSIGKAFLPLAEKLATALTTLTNAITPERVKAFGIVISGTLVVAMIAYKKVLRDVIMRQTMLGWGALATAAGLLAAEILVLTGVFDGVDEGLDKVDKSSSKYLQSLIEMKKEDISAELAKQKARQTELQTTINESNLTKEDEIDLAKSFNAIAQQAIMTQTDATNTYNMNNKALVENTQLTGEQAIATKEEKEAVDESVRVLTEYNLALENGFNTINSYLETQDKIKGMYGSTREAQQESINAQIKETEQLIKTQGAQKEYVAVLEMLQKKKLNLIQVEEQARLKSYSSLANGLGALATSNGKNAKIGARFAQSAAIIDMYAGANKALSKGGGGFVVAAAIIAQGLANVVKIEQQLSNMGGSSGGGGGTYGKFEQGGYVGGNRHSQGGTIIEAERGEFVMSRNAVESIGLETLNQMNQSGGGGSINVSVTGNVLTQDFVEGELAESIKEAVRRGSDFGIG
jgi:hypothetical protein